MNRINKKPTVNCPRSGQPGATPGAGLQPAVLPSLAPGFNLQIKSTFFIRVGRPGDRPECARVAGLPRGRRPARPLTRELIFNRTIFIAAILQNHRPARSSESRTRDRKSTTLHSAIVFAGKHFPTHRRGRKANPGHGRKYFRPWPGFGLKNKHTSVMQSTGGNRQPPTDPNQRTSSALNPASVTIRTIASGASSLSTVSHFSGAARSSDHPPAGTPFCSRAAPIFAEQPPHFAFVLNFWVAIIQAYLKVTIYSI